MDWLTTSTILEDLRDFKNETAWQQLGARFRRPIVHFALRLGVPAADAEDVAQETLLAFAEAYRKGRYNRASGRLSRWLFGIAYKQILRQRRVDARRSAKLAGRQPDTAFWDQVPDEQSASGLWDREWERFLWTHCVERARYEFQPQTFQAFEWAVRGDRSADDTARDLAVSVKVVYNAKHRVLKRIRELRTELEEVQDRDVP